MSLFGPSRRRLFKQAMRAGRDKGAPVDKVRRALKWKGRWESEYEWRISTYGTERMKRLQRGYRAGADFNGRFRVDLGSFDEAWEALRVLQHFGVALFYALGWTENSDTPSLNPEPDRSAAEAYFKCLARDAASHRAASEGGSIVTAPPPSEWDDPPDQIYVVTVGRESLVLECDCTTQERADLFLRVFDALADDLLEILGWRPLPVTN